jgi:acetoin utilization deacetylase AcuC-like enzyme
VAILDIDAHHGDGTENLTADNPSILTYSIHEKGIFPGTGNESDPSRGVYNAPLASRAGDDALLDAVTEFAELTMDFGADLIFVACGADAHQEDPLSSLTYSVEGYVAAAKYLRAAFPDTPILIGGAGGYLPDTRTPEVWSKFAHAIATSNN